MLEFKKYVKKELWNEFEEICKKNSLDFYSCGVILTAHLVMHNMCQSKMWKSLVFQDESPQEAWESAMKSNPYHSGASASFACQMICKYCIKGDEFRKWAKKSGQFMIKWND